MLGNQPIGRSLVMRHRGQKHSTCVKPSAANASMVACRGFMTERSSGVLGDIAAPECAHSGIGTCRVAFPKLSVSGASPLPSGRRLAVWPE